MTQIITLVTAAASLAAASAAPTGHRPPVGADRLRLIGVNPFAPAAVVVQQLAAPIVAEPDDGAAFERWLGRVEMFSAGCLTDRETERAITAFADGVTAGRFADQVMAARHHAGELGRNRVRCAEQRTAVRRRDANNLAPSFRAALARLDGAGSPGLVLKGSRFHGQLEAGGAGVSIDVARRMYAAGLVRFVSSLDATTLQMTERGRATALALRAAP